MKEINENFFKSEINNRQITDLLMKDEKILWKGTPKKLAYVLSKSIGMIPFALIWLFIDMSIIITLITSTNNSGLPFLIIIPFFALHLLPVWICIAQIIKACKEMKHIEYVITNKRIFEVFGQKNKYIRSQLNISDIKNSNLKINGIDRFLKVGDIYISGKNSKTFVLFDIPNSEFISTKINELADKTNSTPSQFYSHSYECEHCGTYYDKRKNKCPSCGAPTEK